MVPATRGDAQSDDPDGDARTAAGQRLESAARALHAMGLDVSGEIGDASPVVASADALRRRCCDEILVATLPPGSSRWLTMGIPQRLSRLFSVPVHHVVVAPAAPGPAAGD